MESDCRSLAHPLARTFIAPLKLIPLSFCVRVCVQCDIVSKRRISVCDPGQRFMFSLSLNWKFSDNKGSSTTYFSRKGKRSSGDSDDRLGWLRMGLVGPGRRAGGRAAAFKGVNGYTIMDTEITLQPDYHCVAMLAQKQERLMKIILGTVKHFSHSRLNPIKTGGRKKFAVKKSDLHFLKKASSKSYHGKSPTSNHRKIPIF